MSYYSVFIRFFLLILIFIGSPIVSAKDQVPMPDMSEVVASPPLEKSLDVSVDPKQKVSQESVAEPMSESGEVAFSTMNKADGPSLMQEGIKTIVMLLVLLVGFWWFSNWLKKSGKLARMSGSNGGIECLSVYSVGQKEKIALIRVKDQELLVGITQHSIQPLHHFKQIESVEDKDAPSDAEFTKLLDKATSES